MQIGTIEQQIAEARQRLATAEQEERDRLERERQFQQVIQDEKDLLAKLEAEQREKDWQQGKVDYQSMLAANQQARAALTSFLETKLDELFGDELRQLIVQVEQTQATAEGFRRPHIGQRQKELIARQYAEHGDAIRGEALAIQQTVDAIANEMPPAYPTWAELGDWAFAERENKVLTARRVGFVMGLFDVPEGSTLFVAQAVKHQILNDPKGARPIRPLI